MLQRRHPSIADDDVGPSVQDRLDQQGDVLPSILVVGVGVDDNIGVNSQRCLQSCREG